MALRFVYELTGTCVRCHAPIFARYPVDLETGQRKPDGKPEAYFTCDCRARLILPGSADSPEYESTGRADAEHVRASREETAELRPGEDPEEEP